MMRSSWECDVWPVPSVQSPLNYAGARDAFSSRAHRDPRFAAYRFLARVSATDIWRVLGALGGVTAVAMPAMTMSEHVMGEGWSEESTPNW